VIWASQDGRFILRAAFSLLFFSAFSNEVSAAINDEFISYLTIEFLDTWASNRTFENSNDFHKAWIFFGR